MTRRNGNATKLATVIEEILNHGAGPMNLSYDDLRVRLRVVGLVLTLDEGAGFIASHLTTALDILGDHGWSSVKTTEYWEYTGYNPPAVEHEIKYCVAGLGRLPDGSSSVAVGLHFTAAADDDWLWAYARSHGGSVWRGKRNKELVRLQIEHDNGHLSPEVFALAESSATDPVIGDKPYRRDVKRLNP